jgi:hypothetical protein
MANVRVVLNPAGMREMLRSKEVERDLLRRGKQVAATAEAIGHLPHEGEVEYYAESTRGKTRAKAIVVADHPGAQGQEEKYRTLGTAIDAARL